MNTDRNRMFFILGTALLVSAVLDVTLFPYLITNYMPEVIIPVDSIKTSVAYLYVISCVLYIFSVGYYNKQLTAIMGVFSYYILFQIFVRLSSLSIF